MSRTAEAFPQRLGDADPTADAAEMAWYTPIVGAQRAAPERTWIFLDEEGSGRPAARAALPARRRAGLTPWAALLAAGVRVVPRGGR